MNSSYGFKRRPIFLRSHAVIAIVDRKTVDWIELSTKLVQVLNLYGSFTITAYLDCKALIEFDTLSDRNALHETQNIYLSNCTLTSRSWSPGTGSLPSDMLKVKGKWVTIKGVPFYLCS